MEKGNQKKINLCYKNNKGLFKLTKANANLGFLSILLTIEP